MGSYANLSDVQAIFGASNVARWSNLERDNAQTAAARVDDAIAWAEAHIDDRFRDGPYVVPLTVSTVVTNLAAKLAGWWLYSSRGLLEKDDSEVAGKMQGHRKEAEDAINAYLCGARRLNAERVDAAPTAPVVVC